MPYVLGANGDILAISFGQPLRSPRHEGLNKIFWVVSRLERGK
jgi:hypothetical protein